MSNHFTNSCLGGASLRTIMFGPRPLLEQRVATLDHDFTHLVSSQISDGARAALYEDGTRAWSKVPPGGPTGTCELSMFAVENRNSPSSSLGRREGVHCPLQVRSRLISAAITCNSVSPEVHTIVHALKRQRLNPLIKECCYSWLWKHYHAQKLFDDLAHL